MNVKSSDTPPIKLRSFLTYRLTRLQAQINAQAQHILRSHSDIGQTEWRVLLLVQDRGESTMALVVRDGQIDKAQVSRAVKSLLEKGLLTSRVDPSDQRQSLLTVTADGMKIYDAVVPKMRERQQHLMEGLSEHEVKLVFDIIDRLEDAAQRRDF